MKKTTKTAAQILMTLICSVTLWAHEGHDEGKTSVQAPNRGIIKKLEEGYIEVVAKKKDVNIYFYDQDLKPADLSKYKVEARAQLPKNKRLDNLQLKSEAGFFTTEYDAQGKHRYTLILNVAFPGNDHNDIIKFTVEPKK